MITVFKKSYLYIMGYGPDNPDAERICRDELAHARRAVERCLSKTLPDSDDLYVSYWVDGADVLCDAIERFYGRNYDLDDDLHDTYNDLLFDLLDEPHGPGEMDHARRRALKVLPRMIRFISRDEVESALNQIEENVDIGYFNRPRDYVMDITTFAMHTEITRNMRIVIEFVARYSN